MKDKTKSVLRQEIAWAYVGLFVCFVFFAAGIFLIVNGIRGGAGNTGSIVFICLGFFGFLGFAIFLFVQCLKRLIPHFKSMKALQHGTESTATICDYRAHYHKNAGNSESPWNYKSYYSIHLKFLDDDGNEIIFKTAANYTAEQFKQLKEKQEIKIKQYKKTAVIIEEFFDPLDYEFHELPKILRINSILVLIMVLISFAVIIAGIVCLCVFDYKKWTFGLFIGGIVLIFISGILKTFIYVATEKFVKNRLPYIRKYNKKMQKKERKKNEKTRV